MKKPPPPEDPASPDVPDPASPVLREAVAPADVGDGVDRQQFVIQTIVPTIADSSMQRAQNQGRESQQDDDTARRPSPSAWEDGSGEGAASALESLRKLEQSRRTAQPLDERPGAE